MTLPFPSIATSGQPRGPQDGASAAAVVLLSGALGDTVLALPMIDVLHRRHGHVVVAARHSQLAILRSSLSQPSVASMDSPPWSTLFAADLGDVAPAVRQLVRSAPVVVNQADVRQGPLWQNLRRLAATESVIDVQTRPPAQWRGHVSDYLLASIAAAPEPTGLVRLRGDAAAQTLRHAWPPSQSVLGGHGAAAEPANRAARVVLQPGAGSPRKCWPIERFLAVASALRDRGERPAFLVGPDELERLGEPYIFSLRQFGEVVGPLPLEDAIAALAAADVVVGNDSGITHVAAALGRPTLALFGPTDPRQWAPRGPRVRILAATSLMDIGPDAVTAAVGELLSTR